MFDDLFTDDAPALESSYDDVTLDGEESLIAGELTSATESSIFLAAMQDMCNTPDEFVDMVNENAVTWQMYGLIDDAEEAMEVAKKVTYDNWKDTRMKRVIGKEVLRLAKANDPANYKKYRDFRNKALALRQKFYQKYLSKAKQNAKAALRNSSSKASNMGSAHGKSIVQATKSEDKRIAEAYRKSSAGKNPTGTAKSK